MLPCDGRKKSCLEIFKRADGVQIPADARKTTRMTEFNIKNTDVI